MSSPTTPDTGTAPVGCAVLDPAQTAVFERVDSHVRGLAAARRATPVIGPGLLSTSLVADRLTADVGDYRGSYGERTHRTVLLSNVLHQEDDETAVAMLAESARVTRAGGHVVVHTHLGEGQRPKLFPSLQGVSAFVLWSGGAGMTESRLRTLVEASGLALDRLEPVRDSGTTLAVCRR